MKKLEYYWYHPGIITILLLPLSYLYCLLVALRRLCYRLSLFKQHTFKVPIIVVGNISVGGTGKTPLVICLIELLRECGYKPGVVSRGYGGTAAAEGKNKPITVTKDSDPVQVGDEPVLIAQRCHCPIIISSSRTNAVQSLLDQTDCDVIISDDGLQHYALKRDVEVAVVDSVRGFGNGLCLPAGPLRERPSRLKSVDMIVYNGSRQHVHLPGLDDKMYSMQLRMNDMKQVGAPEISQNISAFENTTVHAVAGIGNPKRFFDQLRARSIILIEHPFNDHYAYQAGDINFDDNLPVVMTEKDAVKCRAFASAKHWFIPVEAQCDEKFKTEIIQKLKYTG